MHDCILVQSESFSAQQALLNRTKLVHIAQLPAEDFILQLFAYWHACRLGICNHTTGPVLEGLPCKYDGEDEFQVHTMPPTRIRILPSDLVAQGRMRAAMSK